jgi:hypothetical protein
MGWTRRAGTRPWAGLAAAGALLAAACSSAAPQAHPSAAATPASPIAPAPAPTPPTPTPTPPASTAPAVRATPSPADGLAGEPIDFFFAADDTLAVVGVPHHDVLNVRSGPGVAAPVTTTLAPRADVVATGVARQLPRSIWTEVDVDGVTGWVNASYLAYLGETTDVTAEVVADLGADRTARTMPQLGRAVARTRASTDPESAVVVVARPAAGDLGEVTVDVIGLGDDAVLGVRLHVFGQPVDTGRGFDLRAVEQTLLCGRGVSADGRCA